MASLRTGGQGERGLGRAHKFYKYNTAGILQTLKLEERGWKNEQGMQDMPCVRDSFVLGK